MTNKILFSIFFCFPFIIEAQIAAPKFTCIKRDTLLWSAPTVNCGKVTGYEIWGAINKTGPYQLITTINNTAQTRYFFNNLDGTVWYFFMKTVANCGAQTQINSDTLADSPPELNPILTLNVLDNSTVDVRWRKNNTQQVIGYIVYKKTPSGLIPYANVSSRDTVHFTDTKAKPNVASEEYQVLAVDGCGNTSLYDVNHKTILMSASQDKCAQTIKLKWNLYQNWAIPIAKHEIWVSINGRNAYLATFAGGKDTTFIYNGVKNGNRYNFYVKAVQTQSGITSKSNDTTVVANVSQAVTNLFLKNVTVNAQNKPELYWTWNIDARIDSVYILRGSTDSNYTVVGQYKPSLPLDDQSTFTDTSANTAVTSFYYRLQTKDACGVFLKSNTARTVQLKGGAASGRKNLLTWTSFMYPAGTITGYQIIRLNNGAATPIGLPLDIGTTQTTDIVASDESSACYRIGTNFTFPLPDGTTEDATSYSNTVCLQQIIGFWMPNAFTPEGLNSEFKPLLVFKDNIQTYQFSIYDRWGGKIFETITPGEGWNGKRGANNLPQDAYNYILRVTQPDGKIVEQKGIVMLLR